MIGFLIYFLNGIKGLMGLIFMLVHAKTVNFWSLHIVVSPSYKVHLFQVFENRSTRLAETELQADTQIDLVLNELS